MGLLSAIFFLFNWDTDYYLPKWAFITVIGILCFAVGIGINYSIFAALLFAYCLISASLSAFYFSPVHKNRFCYQAAFENLLTVVWGLCIISVATFLPMWVIQDFIKWIPGLLVINMILVFKPIIMTCKRKSTKEHIHKISVYGFGGNASTASTFTSLLAAMMFVSPPWHPYLIPLGLIVAVATVLRTRASSGAGGLAVAIAIFYYKYWFIIWPVYAAIFAYIYFKRKHWLALSHRDYILKFINKHITPLRNKWLGLGVGSFTFIMPAKQAYMKQHKLEEETSPRVMVLWAHCDLYQFYIEAGLIGVVFLLAFATELVWLAPLGCLAFLGAYLSNSVTNFPSHLAPDSLLFLIVCRLIYTT